MPTHLRRTWHYGREAIPPFSQAVTVVQNVTMSWGPYNVACLCMYDRHDLRPLNMSFWSHLQAPGVPNIFGQSRVSVPRGAQWVSLAYAFAPVIIPGEFPQVEDYFRYVFHLGL